MADKRSAWDIIFGGGPSDTEEFHDQWINDLTQLRHAGKINAAEHAAAAKAAETAARAGDPEESDKRAYGVLARLLPKFFGDAPAAQKHYGPGKHPSGSPQTVHAGGQTSADAGLPAGPDMQRARATADRLLAVYSKYAAGTHTQRAQSNVDEVFKAVAVESDPVELAAVGRVLFDYDRAQQKQPGGHDLTTAWRAHELLRDYSGWNPQVKERSDEYFKAHMDMTIDMITLVHDGLSEEDAVREMRGRVGTWFSPEEIRTRYRQAVDEVKTAKAERAARAQARAEQPAAAAKYDRVRDAYAKAYRPLAVERKKLDDGIKNTLEGLLDRHDLDIVEAVEPLLPPGYYQFEFRVRKRALTKLPDGRKGGKLSEAQRARITAWSERHRKLTDRVLDLNDKVAGRDKDAFDAIMDLKQEIDGELG